MEKPPVPQKKDPASAVVEFFSTAPLETVQTVLAIVKGIVARRQPAKTKPRKGSSPRAVGADVAAQG
jgi:hypothetical protein